MFKESPSQFITQDKEDFISVIVVAAGKGERMNMGVKKQFILLEDKPILYYSLKSFCENDFINEIILVTAKEDIPYCENLVAREGLNKVKQIVEGGVKRQDSVFCGLKSVNKNSNVVLIHDGARPFVESLDLKNLVQVAKVHGSATFGVMLKDTIKVKNDDMYIEKTLDRRNLVAIQTPQAFLYNKLWDAHIRAKQEAYVGTDDTVLMERCNIPTKVVDGSYFNIKITTKEDLAFAEVITKKLLTQSDKSPASKRQRRRWVTSKT